MRRFLLIFLAAMAAILLFAWAITVQPLVQPIASQPPAPDEARLRTDVRHLSQTIYPRSFDQPRKLAAAAAYIKSRLIAAGATVSEQDVLVQGERFVNLIARFGPKTGPLTVVGAHYDSHGETIARQKDGKSFSLETHTPGADDNASGVAGLLELARLLAQHPPARPVELVAYTLEEPPHFRSDDMGSARHAKSLADAARPVELMISLEMIGYFSDAEGSQLYPFPGMTLLYPDRGNFIGIVSRLQDWRQTRRLKAAMAGASDLPVRSINTLPSVPGVDFSDHLSYWNAGIPAVMVTDTSFERNAEYHQAGDTWDRLDYRRMGQVVRGIFAYVSRP